MKRLWSICLLLAVLPACVALPSPVDAACQKYRDVLLDTRGNAIAGASVTVTDTDAGTSATLYSERTCASTTGNPVTTETDGSFEFYIKVASFYTITPSHPSYTFTPVEHAQIGHNYKEGTWTPTATFATPGDVAVSYSTRVGTYTKTGNQVRATFMITATTITHTTASGLLQVTGLPFAAASGVSYTATLLFDGITKANYTQFTPSVSSGASLINFVASGQGQTLSNVGASDVPTGGLMRLWGTLIYQTDAE